MILNKKFFLASILILSVSTVIEAKTGEEIADELGINASSKAIKQWERLFKKPERMANKIPGSASLTMEELNILKEYLIDHAADSDHPAAAGL